MCLLTDLKVERMKWRGGQVTLFWPCPLGLTTVSPVVILLHISMSSSPPFNLTFAFISTRVQSIMVTFSKAVCSGRKRTSVHSGSLTFCHSVHPWSLSLRKEPSLCSLLAVLHFLLAPLCFVHPLRHPLCKHGPG